MPPFAIASKFCNLDILSSMLASLEVAAWLPIFSRSSSLYLWRSSLSGPRSIVRVFKTNLDYLALLIRFVLGSMRFAELSDLSDLERSLKCPALPRMPELTLLLFPTETLLPLLLRKFWPEPRIYGLLAFIEPETAPSRRILLPLPSYP